MQPTKTSVVGLFTVPQQYLVPIFQRGYVWTLEEQVKPLWEDIVDRVEDLARRRENVAKGIESAEFKQLRTHFLGTVVLGQAVNPGFGHATTREVIDGQQRITTLQIFFLAFRDVAKHLNDDFINSVFETYTRNPGPYQNQKDHFKVWPTNVGREEIVDLATLGSLAAVCKRFPLGIKNAETGKVAKHQRSLMVEAYLFFFAMLNLHLAGKRYDDLMPIVNGGDEQTLADAVIRSIRRDEAIKIPLVDPALSAERGTLLLEALDKAFQIMALQLDEEDDPQIIFETLNARGAQLYPSDLARNFVFLQATRKGENVDQLYDSHWKEFDEKVDASASAKGAKFWKKEERQGRLKNSRLDLLLYHYVGLRTQQETKVSHVFEEFKQWWQSENRATDGELARLVLLAKHFEMFLAPTQGTRYGLFCYRMRALDMSTMTPLVFYLLEHHEPESPEFLQAIGDLESYLVRRYVCRLTTQGYNRIFLNRILGDLVRKKKSDAGSLRTALLELGGPSQVWPDDATFEEHWKSMRLYRGGGKSAPRMILEALERKSRTQKQESSAVQEGLSIEHVMPQKWTPEAWPLAIDTPDTRADRNRLLHTVGNLTLLTQAMNSTVGNGSFSGKRGEIAGNSQFQLNVYFQKMSDSAPWTEDSIRTRSDVLFKLAKDIWPKP
jgi:hypothetical protein